MTHVEIAAGLLEVEAVLMNCRAQGLLRNRDLFTARLLEAHAKIDALATALLTDGGATLTKLFLAVSESPLSDDAVDPQAGLTRG